MSMYSPYPWKTVKVYHNFLTKDLKGQLIEMNTTQTGKIKTRQITTFLDQNLSELIDYSFWFTQIKMRMQKIVTQKVLFNKI